MRKTSKIENMEVEYSDNIYAECGDYCIYDNKIWKVVASDFNGKTLVKEIKNEKIFLKRKDNIKIYKVLKPTGYIKI